MPRITRVVTVPASPGQVMGYICDVNNHPAFIPSLKTVENVPADPRPAGSAWDWTFAMAGVQIRGKAATVAAVEGQRFSFKTTGGIDSTFTYTAEPAGTDTRLTLDVVYEVPQSVLAKALDRAVIERMNEAEADRVVENIQVIFSA